MNRRNEKTALEPFELLSALCSFDHTNQYYDFRYSETVSNNLISLQKRQSIFYH